MSAINSSIYEDIEISAETTTGKGDTLDLRLGVVKFNYFEDLFSPTITAEVLVASAGNATNAAGDVLETVYSGLPIRGGERVKINIAPNTKTNKPLKFDTPDTYLYVSNVSRQFADGAKELFTLDLVSREAITNETSRLSEKYYKTSPISDTVKKIIETKLASTIDEKNIDRTVNTYPFIGNLKTPFHTLVWLASKSQPEKGLPGYFFYQTKDGFNFRSIESLIKGKSNPKYTYFERKFTQSSRIIDTLDDTIISYNVSQNNDLLTKLMMGQFSSHIMEFDPLTGYFTTEEQGKFTLDDSTNQKIRFLEPEKSDNVVKTEDVETLGATPEIPVLLNDDDQNLGSLPSRMITMIADRGTLSFDPSVERGSTPTLWQRQALMRYQLLFTQIVNMLVPLNTNLVVGDIINIKFLNANMEAKEHDRRQSGSYMIKSLCHSFDANQSVTSLTLVRDAFGEITK